MAKNIKYIRPSINMLNEFLSRINNLCLFNNYKRPNNTVRDIRYGIICLIIDDFMTKTSLKDAISILFGFHGAVETKYPMDVRKLNICQLFNLN